MHRSALEVGLMEPACLYVETDSAVSAAHLGSVRSVWKLGCYGRVCDFSALWSVAFLNALWLSAFLQSWGSVGKLSKLSLGVSVSTAI